jgi:hypothetical protein
MRKKPAVLLDISDLSSQQNWRLTPNILPANSYLATLGLDQPIEAPEKRRFAGSTFSDQGHRFPCRNIDTDVIERDDVAKSLRDISGS